MWNSSFCTDARLQLLWNILFWFPLIKLKKTKNKQKTIGITWLIYLSSIWNNYIDSNKLYIYIILVTFWSYSQQACLNLFFKDCCSWRVRVIKWGLVGEYNFLGDHFWIIFYHCLIWYYRKAVVLFYPFTVGTVMFPNSDNTQ